MTYIIATSDQSSGDELIKILQESTAMDCMGNFATFKAAETCIRGRPLDMAYIWLDVLNAFRLARVIKEQNPFSKVVFVSSQREDAVDAFEHEADGFLLTPFDKDKIERTLRQNMERGIL